jgi:hypothetical protein
MRLPLRFINWLFTNWLKDKFLLSPLLDLQSDIVRSQRYRSLHLLYRASLAFEQIPATMIDLSSLDSGMFQVPWPTRLSYQSPSRQEVLLELRNLMEVLR